MKEKHREKAEKLLGGKIEEFVDDCCCTGCSEGLSCDRATYTNEAISKAVPIVADLLEKVEQLEKKTSKAITQITTEMNEFGGSEKMYIIGIDPGKTGAAAHILDGRLLRVDPFKGNIDNCRLVGTRKLDGQFFTIPNFFIEKVGPSPRMGVSSAFTFGRWAEAVECSVRVLNSPVHMIRPVTWQNAIGVYSGGDKGILYKHAKKLFPEEYKSRMFCKNTSDAVLIAYYGWRFMVNQEEGQ